MLELLSPQLARANPKAYIAHFRRLGEEARRAYVAGLSAAEHQLHLAVLGEGAVVGLVLDLLGPAPTLTVTVGGAASEVAEGWEAVQALQARAFERARVLGEVVATGLVRLSASQVEAVGVAGWKVEEVRLALDEDAASFTVHGQLPGGGVFWSAARGVEGPVEALEALAGRLGVLVTR